MKMVVLRLTIPQAHALRGMVVQSAEMTGEKPASPVDIRALAKLEDALEEAMGTQFVYRWTERKA